jgi:hypothetical protein
MGSLAALQEELERLRKENTQLQNDLTNAHTTIQSTFQIDFHSHSQRVSTNSQLNAV